MKPLSPRQAQILPLFADGWTAQQIADAFGLKITAVREHIKNGRVKYRDAGFDVSTRMKLRARLVKEGVLHE
jgi:two-component system uhpT operon response regulator UhpA